MLLYGFCFAFFSDAVMNCVPAHVIMLMSLNNYVGFSSLCQLRAQKSNEHSLLVFCMAKYDFPGFFKCFYDHMLRNWNFKKLYLGEPLLTFACEQQFPFLYSINLPGKCSKKEFSEHSAIFPVFFITTVPTYYKHFIQNKCIFTIKKQTGFNGIFM